jgi:hypothetical protein
MEKNFILTILALDELKEFGYQEVWIGNVENPHWPRHGNNGFIIASPKVRKNNSPAVWLLDENRFGKQSCGNGLKKADQSQREHKLVSGHYKLADGNWIKQ